MLIFKGRRMKDSIVINHEVKQQLLAFLMGFVSVNKSEKFSRYIEKRTKQVTIILEDIFQPHNASAVLRSCDCFGIQDVHIIENKNKYEVNPDVALGSSKWLTLYRYNKNENNTVTCLESLKQRGYRIIATTPNNNEFTPDDLPLDPKFALVFGTEMRGLSDEALALADEFITIPMVGFTESLNISVSAAILLYTLTERIRKTTIDWQVHEEERTDILLSWARHVVKKSTLLEKEFFKKMEDTTRSL
jgi:tRNA (guanosine-2'-O-)-methyltransferase